MIPTLRIRLCGRERPARRRLLQRSPAGCGWASATAAGGRRLEVRLRFGRCSLAVAARNPDYFEAIPLETLQAATLKEHIYEKEILDVYREKLEERKEERKSLIELRRSSMAGPDDDGGPVAAQPKDEETGDDEERDENEERPSAMVEGRMMLPGVLETYNPLANTAYEVYFAEDVVEELVQEYGMPTLEEAGKMKLKELDDVPNPEIDEETGLVVKHEDGAQAAADEDEKPAPAADEEPTVEPTPAADEEPTVEPTPAVEAGEDAGEDEAPADETPAEDAPEGKDE